MASPLSCIGRAGSREAPPCAVALPVRNGNRHLLSNLPPVIANVRILVAPLRHTAERSQARRGYTRPEGGLHVPAGTFSSTVAIARGGTRCCRVRRRQLERNDGTSDEPTSDEAVGRRRSSG